MRRSIVRVIGVSITFLHPNRLFHQLPRRLQIVGIELLGGDVIVSIQRRRYLLRSGRGLRVLFMAMVEDVTGTYCRDQNGRYEEKLDLLLSLGADRHLVGPQMV